MIDLSTLFLSVHNGSIPAVFGSLNPKFEQEERLDIEKIISCIKNAVKPSDVSKITAVLVYLETIEQYIRWMDYPIYLNEFKDKKGNRYLQARTSIKDINGKTNWVNAYIGSMKDYPKGINDPSAMEKAKPLVRKKLKKYFGVK